MFSERIKRGWKAEPGEYRWRPVPVTAKPDGHYVVSLECIETGELIDVDMVRAGKLLGDDLIADCTASHRARMNRIVELVEGKKKS